MAIWRAKRRAVRGAAKGYVTHAQKNQRRIAAMVLAYVLSFELIGAFTLTLVLLFVDPDHTILTNPIGYAARYGLPLAILSALIFWLLYRGHAGMVARRLAVQFVSCDEEPRFVAIAEEQCTALGVRLPRFGVIEVPEPNAVTVGEGPARGMIAVTRGLLDLLDDDELAGVLAHEASHIRQGDTAVFAANHALMRTAVVLQAYNVLRLEDWRLLIFPLFLPCVMTLVLASGAVMMPALQLARFARRGIKLARDHVADGEAIRVTHFPDALIGALRKVGGRGAFAGSYAVEELLFDGLADREGGTHPAVEDRLAAITMLAGDLMAPGRQRRDTRQAHSAPAQRRRARHSQDAYPRDGAGRVLQKPELPLLSALILYFRDRDAYLDYETACIDWQAWRVDDRRNAFGIAPKMMLPVAATLVFITVFHWPADGNFARFVHVFNPATLVEVAHKLNAGPGVMSATSTPKVKPGSSAVTSPPAAPSAATPGPTFWQRAMIWIQYLVAFVLVALFHEAKARKKKQRAVCSEGGGGDMGRSPIALPAGDFSDRQAPPQFGRRRAASLVQPD